MPAIASRRHDRVSRNPVAHHSVRDADGRGQVQFRHLLIDGENGLEMMLKPFGEAINRVCDGSVERDDVQTIAQVVMSRAKMPSVNVARGVGTGGGGVVTGVEFSRVTFAIKR